MNDGELVTITPTPEVLPPWYDEHYYQDEMYTPDGQGIVFPESDIFDKFTWNYLDVKRDKQYLDSMATPDNATMCLYQINAMEKQQTYELIQIRTVVTVFTLSFMFVTLVRFFKNKFRCGAE